MTEETSVKTNIGQQFGNYRLTSLVGRGGFAEVYLGEHVYLKTQAAIKILQARLSSEEQERFYAESRTVAHLQHEHIVRVLEFGLKDESIPYLVMEYAPNGTLRERFPRGKPVPLAHVLPPLKQVASALHYAHNANLVHRDIKPENMLLGAHDEVLLSDFGIALMIKGSQRQDAQEVAGTVTYMAPEQLQGRPTRTSDQYALAVVVYEWLSGQRLFSGTFTSIATQHMFTPPPSLQERVPGISAAVDQVVLKALAKDPQQRFASVQEFFQALEAAALGNTATNININNEPGSISLPTYTVSAGTPLPSTTSAPTPGFITPTHPAPTRPSPQRRLAIGLIVLALLLVVGSGLAYVWSRQQTTANSSHPQQDMQALYASATRGEPQIEDPLHTEGSLAWLLTSSGTCHFQGGTLHAAGKGVGLCNTAYTNLSNFAFQAEMTILQGPDGGLIFRNELLPNPNGGIYYFMITTQGDFNLGVKSITYVNKQYSSSGLNILLQRHSTAIKTGLNQANLLTVIARGPTISLYINKQFVGSVNDSTSLSGTIGLFSQGATADQSLDVAFKNAQIWIS